MQATGEVRTYGNFIGGKWVDPHGDYIESRNPATGDLVARAPKSSTDEVGHAIEEARKAFDSGSWGAKRPADRAKGLREISDAIRNKVDELSVLLTLETGKPLADSKGELTNAAWPSCSARSP